MPCVRMRKSKEKCHNIPAREITSSGVKNGLRKKEKKGDKEAKKVFRKAWNRLAENFFVICGKPSTVLRFFSVFYRDFMPFYRINMQIIYEKQSQRLKITHFFDKPEPYLF